MKKSSRCGVVGVSFSTRMYWAGIAVAWLLAAGHACADGCFVFTWNKQKDINEPTQKAIILHDQGQEDLVLQVRYEGPAEDFGWLIPVPGLPQVRKASMSCFYELSRLTQERFPERSMLAASKGLQEGDAEAVKVIEIKTVGAYEVAVLSAGNATNLSKWLDAHHFTFPKEKQSVLDGYIKNHWYFVAAKINPEGNGFTLKSGPPKPAAISSNTRQKLANGELHPLVISFPSEKCLFPLAISAVNGKPSEVSLYVLSADPRMNPVIFNRNFEAYRQARAKWINERPERQKKREEARKRIETHESMLPQWPARPYDDPADPQPDLATMRQQLGMPGLRSGITESDDDFGYAGLLVTSMEVKPKDLPACSRELPRLAGKSWWLTKQVATFTPEEMRDLQFEPAIPALAGMLRTPDGRGAADCLSLFGARAVPVILAGLKSSDPTERRLAASAVATMAYAYEPDAPFYDSRLVGPLLELMSDPEARVRAKACEAAGANWNAKFVPRLTELLQDRNEEVSSAASWVLGRHLDDLGPQMPVYRKLVEEDGPAAAKAITLLSSSDLNLSREQWVRLLSSTNLPVVSRAFSQLRSSIQPDEITPLLTNSLPLARLMGLGCLVRIGDKPAVDRIVSMLNDPNEAIRWRVRSTLRRLTGQKLGPDPAAWEKWWAENKDTFTLPPRPQSMGPERN